MLELQVVSRKLRVMLVDDHKPVRDGLRALLEATGEFTLVGEAATVEEAIAVAAAVRPEVIVMDVRLGAGSGVEATRAIRAQRPATRVLMLTSYADDQALAASLTAGASGYVLKQLRGGELVQAIRAVGQGQPWPKVLTEPGPGPSRQGRLVNWIATRKALD
jgi:two-component system response regulator DevR